MSCSAGGRCGATSWRNDAESRTGEFAWALMPSIVVRGRFRSLTRHLCHERCGDAAKNRSELGRLAQPLADEARQLAAAGLDEACVGLPSLLAQREAAGGPVGGEVAEVDEPRSQPRDAGRCGVRLIRAREPPEQPRLRR